MIKINNKEKIINARHYFLSNTQQCTFSKFIILLYYWDIEHYKQTGMSISGIIYKAYGSMPLPSPIKDILKIYYFISDTNFDNSVFTKRELRILQEVSEKYNNASVPEMIDESINELLPWQVALKERGEGTKIDFNIIMDKSNPLSSEILADAEEKHQFIKVINSVHRN